MLGKCDKRSEVFPLQQSLPFKVFPVFSSFHCTSTRNIVMRVTVPDIAVVVVTAADSWKETKAKANPSNWNTFYFSLAKTIHSWIGTWFANHCVNLQKISITNVHPSPTATGLPPFCFSTAKISSLLCIQVEVPQMLLGFSTPWCFGITSSNRWQGMDSWLTNLLRHAIIPSTGIWIVVLWPKCNSPSLGHFETLFGSTHLGQNWQQTSKETKHGVCQGLSVHINWFLFGAKCSVVLSFRKLAVFDSLSHQHCIWKTDEQKNTLKVLYTDQFWKLQIQ